MNLKDYELIKLCACFEFGCSNGSAKAALCGLASFYTTGDEFISEPVAKLAARSCLQTHTLLSALKWLEEKGVIFTDKCNGRRTRYVINEEALASGTIVKVDNATNVKIDNGVESATIVKVDNATIVKVDNGTNVKVNNALAHTSKKEESKKELVTTNYSSEDLDAPIGEQIANVHANHITSICEQKDYILNGHEMVGMAKVNGIHINHSPKLDDIAARRVITVQIFNRCVDKYRKSNAKGPGWLIGTLNNVSLNPKNILEDIRKEAATRGFLADCGLDVDDGIPF